MAKPTLLPDETFSVVTFSRESLEKQTDTLLTDTLINFETNYAPLYLHNEIGSGVHLFSREVLTRLCEGKEDVMAIPGYAEMKADLEEIGRIMDEQKATYFRVVK